MRADRAAVSLSDTSHIRKPAVVAALAIALALAAAPAHAYIGPGAGFAVLGSFLVLFVTLILAAFTLATWPIRYLLRLVRGRRAYTRSKVNRLVIVGLDGLDPRLVERMMEEGKLPNLVCLRDMGSYSRLETTTPPLSPVAWSSFQTGVNPARHNIYDFLTRSPKTYLPDLSSTEITAPRRSLKLGRYRIPLSRPGVRLLRRSKAFWSILSEHGIWSTILRVPITFPPEKFNGLLISAMCVPDLKGSQGTFSFFTTGDGDRRHTGGVRIPLRRDGDRFTASIPGPVSPLSDDGTELRLPFTLTPNDGGATLDISGQRIPLRTGEHSEWVRLTFKAGLGVKVSGICRFVLKSVAPECELYATPINIDPDRPAMPVSYPVTYAIYFAKLFGPFATLGLAEDTWALNERVIDEGTFLEQCYLIHDEREKMFFDALDKTRRGVCACVFDATDRVQHMFYRYLDDRHPANAGKDVERHANAIEDVYRRADDLVGRVLERLDDRTVLLVLSDHGFRSFRRGVNLNSWLHREGYLALKDGKPSSGEWFADVDWDRTRAYAIGLGGIYLNRKGREARGVLGTDEADALKAEIAGKLSGVRDPDMSEVAINQAFDAAATYSGPYVGEAPDLLIGYNDGYRTSWDGAVGKVTDVVFEDNTRSWSGDHCVDPALVPGVLFCNRPIAAEQPRMVDIAATALDLFGVEVPKYMDGKPLLADAAATNEAINEKQKAEA
ncbi:MAG: alkaline phosphatase family protein [Armatimonadota bacterium]|nr:MAG: alkaline phosphatase family protein [Armatimonadota bacterium]